MNIFFDHQTFSLQEYGGISRYYAELITGINRTPNNQAYLPLLFSNNVHLSETGFPRRTFLPDRNFYKKIQFIYRSNKAYTIAQLRRKSFDVFHATYYDPYFLSYLKGKPFVITFLDMIHEKLGEQFPDLNDGGLTTMRKQLLANYASRIIVISESTKRDVVELLHVDPAKIDIVYLGNSLQLVSHTSLVEDSSIAPYLLYVGRREHYKNFQGLLRAISPLLRQHKLKLVCAGGGSFTKEEELLIRSNRVHQLVEQRSITNESLQMLYQQALAFIFPTFYEGFGIPILEAFACNCPCIVSKLSSLPEVAGNAALYIDPASSESIVNAVEKLLYHPQLRQELIQNGQIQLARFSWQHTVNQTLSIYHSLT